MTADSPPSHSPAIGRFFFAATVLLSAFLLFQVQPLLGKSILPWFGGSPAVWTTAMLFFQITLFAGYAYAHGIVRFLPTTAQAGLHTIVLTAACLLLPIVPAESWKGRDVEDPTGVIFALLAVTVGLPYFALSATGPLLQAWYHAWKADGSPYRLYALSNAGSLAGLLTYPLLVEPNLRLRAQANSWSLGFGVFAGCCALTGLLVAQSGRLRVEQAEQRRPAPKVTWPERLAWLGLSMLGSVLLLATTNHVCQDVAVFPFLWVIPLALYLLTFIVCFDRPQWYVRKWIAAAAVLWLLTTESSHVLEEALDRRLGIVALASLSFGALFLGCMVCHGELVRRAPAPAKLTEFYLFMSAGGALGGMFVGLVAPAIFNAFWEWPLAIAATVLVALVAVWDEFRPSEPETRRQWLARTAITAVTGALVLMQVGQGALDRRPAIFAERNFYGVVTVSDEAPSAGSDAIRMMVNGGIQHGRQFLDDRRRREPLAYYGRETGVAQALTARKQHVGLKVGVVGLGVGTLATYAEPGHLYRFYEINPIVDLAAREYFTYLEDCLGQAETVIGDARLVLEREEPQQFDVLVLDAFSGDAVPAHLLTVEAFGIYLRHLKPDGVIAVHITNTYLKLDPVVLAIARHHGLEAVHIETSQDPARKLERTSYMILSRDPAQLAHLEGRRETAPPDNHHLWSDDFSDLLSVMKAD
jgi:hypothetical protein